MQNCAKCKTSLHNFQHFKKFHFTLYSRLVRVLLKWEMANLQFPWVRQSRWSTQRTTWADSRDVRASKKKIMQNIYLLFYWTQDLVSLGSDLCLWVQMSLTHPLTRGKGGWCPIRILFFLAEWNKTISNMIVFKPFRCSCITAVSGLDHCPCGNSDTTDWQVSRNVPSFYFTLISPTVPKCVLSLSSSPLIKSIVFNLADL